MDKNIDKVKMGKFLQPTSILYYGKYLFYFQKDFKSGEIDHKI